MIAITETGNDNNVTNSETFDVNKYSDAIVVLIAQIAIVAENVCLSNAASLNPINLDVNSTEYLIHFLNKYYYY